MLFPYTSLFRSRFVARTTATSGRTIADGPGRDSDERRGVGVLMVLLQSAAFGLAQLGYIAWTRRRTGLDVAFVPALVFTAQGLAVFAGGMLGLLPQSAWAVVVVGVALLAVEAWRAPDGLRELVREPALWLLAGAAVALAWYLPGQVRVSYDNFGPWALVVRVMLAEGRFPTAEDTVVVFQSYPLGSASFVYLFNRTLTAAESVAMLAQQLLTFSYVLALLSATPRRKGVGVVAVVGTYWVVAEFEIFVNSLLVDTLLGVMSGYLVLLVWANRDRLRSLLLPIAIVMSFLAMTKNSGLFTVVLASVAVLVLTRGAYDGPPAASGRHRGWSVTQGLHLVAASRAPRTVGVPA